MIDATAPPPCPTCNVNHVLLVSTRAQVLPLQTHGSCKPWIHKNCHRMHTAATPCRTCISTHNFCRQPSSGWASHKSCELRQRDMEELNKLGGCEAGRHRVGKSEYSGPSTTSFSNMHMPCKARPARWCPAGAYLVQRANDSPQVRPARETPQRALACTPNCRLWQPHEGFSRHV